MHLCRTKNKLPILAVNRRFHALSVKAEKLLAINRHFCMHLNLLSTSTYSSRFFGTTFYFLESRKLLHYFYFLKSRLLA